MKWCLTPVDKECPINEHFAYNNKNEPICICNENFIRINGSCVEYNICDPLHRKEKGEQPEIPCENGLAECQPLPNDKYRCVCPSNLYNVKGNFGKYAQCRDRFCDLYMECDQKCVFNSTSGQHNCVCFNSQYKLDSDNKCQILENFREKLAKCLPEDPQSLNTLEMPYLDLVGNCMCRFGYNYNATSKKCEDNDNDKIHKILGCESFRINDDGKFECQCPKGKEFDNHYGECRWKPCPSDMMIKYAHDKNDPGNFECISPCDSKLVRSCLAVGGQFFECHPNLAIESLIRNNWNWNIDEPFVQGVHHTIANVFNYCRCIFGLTLDSSERRCIPKHDLNYFTIDMTFTKINNKDITELFFREILSILYDYERLTIESVTCTENDDESFECKAVLSTSDFSITPDAIKKLLEINCINKAQLFAKSSNDSCVYLYKSTKKGQNQITIERKTDSIIHSDPYDFCQSNPCSFFPNSYCESNPKDRSDFKCKCGDGYKIDENFPTPVMDQYHACKLKSCKDLGYHCEDSKATCLMLNGHSIQNIEQKLQAKLVFDSPIIVNDDDGLKSPKPFCLCNNGYLLNKLNSSCDDHCKMNCNNGECYYTMSQKRETCICNEGWMGEKCDVKKSDNDNDNNNNDNDDDDGKNGYKISTIILAILTALLIVGVIFLFIRSRLIRPSTSSISSSSSTSSRLQTNHGQTESRNTIINQHYHSRTDRSSVQILHISKSNKFDD
nr:uncharacterized protein LOC124496010 isoform X1 [Dermatophagoides farinae]